MAGVVVVVGGGGGGGGWLNLKFSRALPARLLAGKRLTASWRLRTSSWSAVREDSRSVAS